jgi:hypothetical protein
MDPDVGFAYPLNVSNENAKMFSGCTLLGFGADTPGQGPGVPCDPPPNLEYPAGTFFDVDVDCDGAGSLSILKLAPGCGTSEQFRGQINATFDADGNITSSTGGLLEDGAVPIQVIVNLVIDSGSWGKDPETGECFKLDETSGEEEEETPVAVCGGGTQDCFMVNGICYPAEVVLTASWGFGITGNGNMFVDDPALGGGKVLDKWETSGSGTDDKGNEFDYDLNNKGINGFSILLTYSSYTILLKFDKDGTYQPQMTSWTGSLPSEYDSDWFLGLDNMGVSSPKCDIAVPPEA